VIKSVTYWGIPGERDIMSAELTNVIILGVKREGIGHTVRDDEIPVPEGMRACAYTPGLGRLRFGTVFAQPPDEFVAIQDCEKIWVLYKVP
jgi:hypothetical protein